jgi:hypothetical protein
VDVSGSPRALVLATPAAAWGAGVLLLGLTLHLAIAPQTGLPVATLTLGLGVALVLMLALRELERDVIQMALLGGILGGLGEAWFLGVESFWHGLLSGLLVGALVGDEVQLSRNWLRLTRQAKTEQRWWQRLPAESKWLPRVVWAFFAVALMAMLTMPWWLPTQVGSRLADDLFRVFRERRLESNVLANVFSVWYAVVPLAMALALSRFAARVPNQTLLVDGLLRRVAVLQCAALLLLAANALVSWSDWPSVIRYTYAEHYLYQVDALVDVLRLALVPCLLLMLSQIFLGRRLFRFWRRSGWIVAIGGLGLLSAGMLGFLIAYLLDAARL